MFAATLALGFLARGARGAVVGVDAHGNVLPEQKYKSQNVSALRAALMNGYDRFELPPVVDENPERGVRVHLQLALNQLTSIDVSQQTIDLYAWWRHNWIDPRLAWRPEDWGGVAELTFVGRGPHKEIWMPDDTIFDASESEEQMEDLLVDVYPDGGVWVSIPISNTVPCPMKLGRFPFDIQECTFTIGSWTLNGVYVDMVPRLNGDGDYEAFTFTKTFVDHTEYDLLAVKTSHFDTFYTCCVEPYPVIEFELRFRRHSITYITGILMPMILSTFVGMLAFGLNPGSGERISLGVTVMLTNAAIYIVAFQVLPKGSDWSALTYVHIVSFIFALMTLVVSLMSVSLYCVKPAHGCRESELLHSFIQADKDGSGDIDKDELKDVVDDLGLSPTSRVQLFLSLQKTESKALDLDKWYDVVAQIYDQSHLAAYHSWLYVRLLVPLIHRERKRRKESILRRIRALCEMSAEMGEDVSEEEIAAAITGRVRVPPRLKKTLSASRTLSATSQSASASGDGLESPPTPRRASLSARRPSGVWWRPGRRPSLPQSEQSFSYADALTDTGDIADPTEFVARKLAGTIDWAFSLVLPIAYCIIIVIVLRPFDRKEGCFQETSKCTEVSHVHDGVRTWTKRC